MRLQSFYHVSLLLFITTTTSIGYVKADTVSTSNESTGQNSSNTSDVTIRRDSSESITNSGTTVTNISGSFNTGGNRTLNNTTVDGAKTGSIDARVGVINEANTATSTSGHVGGSQSSPILNVTTHNQSTGPGSTNFSTISIATARRDTVVNSADVRNNVDVSGNTGGNVFSNNTHVGNVGSGNINVTFGVVNRVNTTPGLPAVPIVPTPPTIGPIPAPTPTPTTPSIGDGRGGGGSIILPVINVAQAATSPAKKSTASKTYFATGNSNPLLALLTPFMLIAFLTYIASLARKRTTAA